MSGVIPGVNDIETVFPEVAKEWDYEKNGDLLPSALGTGTSKKIWWKCKAGHSWQALISNRIKGTGCPYCSGRLAIPGENDLATLHPQIAVEWDHEHNSGLLPCNFLPHSEKKVWWIGSCGHRWYAAICDRVKGGKCPYCLGKKVLKGFNDLETVNPELAMEWNYEKNAGLKSIKGEDISTPDKVTKSSSYKVWWKCKYGHEWLATVNKRDANRGCPLCSGKQTSIPEQAIVYYLSSLFKVLNREKICGYEVDIFLPEYNIGIEYDGEYYHRNNKNDNLKDNALTKRGVKLIRVKEADKNLCEEFRIYFNKAQMELNFNWACHRLFSLISDLTGNADARNIDADLKRDYLIIRERIDLHLKEKNLLTEYPIIASEWDYDRNGILKPEMFEKSSNQNVWWICRKGHQWKSTINNRTGINKNGCPYCSNKRVLTGFNDLATTYPNITEEWDYEKNTNLSPERVLPKTNEKVWWKCQKGHSWQATINSRTRQYVGCPFCSGRYVISGKTDLQTLFPSVAAEWNKERNKNLLPTDVTAYSHRKVWWKCSKGHEWESIVSNRTGISKNGCPYCSGKIPRAVICVETGTKYSGVSEAQKDTGFVHIGDCCKGLRKTAGGFHWKYC